ncbi:ATP-binding protein [Danxiaibacter flavus]|uniref:histidine kinase n=1 Tax=Danxiaibacter flavus TaxID=3049108 RepID=A0ABV3ZMU6_9BACT|nr:ATP-binding protein [Chitinophagaceae bacterium DXS]
MLDKMNEISANIAEMMNDASIDRLMAIDTDWKIIAWNKTTEILSGILRDEVLGKNLLKVFPQLEQDEEIMSGFRLAMDGIKSFIPAAEGKFNRDYYENHFIPLEDEDGKRIGVMNIMHDVAHRIKAEQQLHKLNELLKKQYQQLEKTTAELATFTSITSTDLKEPVKKLYTSLELLVRSEGANLTNHGKAGLRRMQSSLTKMNLLLDDILAFSAANSIGNELERFDLNEVLQRVLESLRQKIAARQAVIEAHDLPVMYGSRQMLQYLLYNLIDNALKFQQDGNIPKITISAANVERQQDKGGDGTNLKAYLCITVRDNGIGFAQEDADKIFMLFEKIHPRKEYPGSGIGLTISRKIVEAHGGFIEVESQPGKGSAFHCCLSLMDEDGGSQATSGENGPA